MPDDPCGSALLDAARRALLDEVVPGLEDRPRYVALMVANAIGIASREIAAADSAGGAGTEPVASADLKTLTRSIRAGRHDADAALFEGLRTANAAASAIWKPVARS